MTLEPDFDIKSSGIISRECIDRNLLSFKDAALYIKQLPYGRNSNKEDLTSVFTDQCGTCSTKHALLKQLCIENDFREIRLFTGLFKMNSRNTPQVFETLSLNNLDYIPEAHCYMKYHDLILDCTKHNSDPSDFITDLIEEVEIMPGQITDYKVSYHQQYLKSWLAQNDGLNITIDELWEIREQCIRDIGYNPKALS